MECNGILWSVSEYIMEVSEYIMECIGIYNGV